MGVRIPLSVVPDSTPILPSGAYKFAIEKLEETVTGDNAQTPGAKMFVFHFRVVEPQACEGLPYYERCVVGTADDLEAEEPDTWQKSVGARILKRIIKALGMEIGDYDSEELAAAVEAQEVIGVVAQNTQKGGQYEGRVQNQSLGWYMVGEKEPGLDAGNGATAPKAAAKAAPAKPVGVTLQKPVAGAPATAKVAAPAAAKTAAPAAKAAVPKQQSLKCGMCGEMVPRAEFPKHVAAHENDEQE